MAHRVAERTGWTWWALLIVLVIGCNTTSSSAQEAPDPWAMLPQILERIVPPSFPERVFDVTRSGAIGDGQTDCTVAFGKAIAECHIAGGGRVLISKGCYRTGPIHLKSNVELHLVEGAELVFSDRFEDYLPPVLVRVGGIELYNYSPLIYARDCTNIAVTGKGNLNGNAKAWWEWKGRETRRGFEMGARGVPVEQRVFGTTEAAIRPSFLSFVSCTNILLEDFTIGSGPNWTLHPVYCENTTIRRVKVITDGPNNDGIDPDSCLDLLIEDCTFDTGDDCVVLKSGYNEDGWRVGRPTENVVMRRCSSKQGHGGLVVGSEMSGDVRHVFMYDCNFEGTDRALRIKSRRGRGGVVERIYVRDLSVKNMQREVIILNMDYSADRNQAANEQPPVFRDMLFENITGQGAPTAILIQGLEDSPIENVRFKNMTIQATKGVVATHARNLLFDAVDVVPESGPAFAFTEVADSMIRNVTAAPGTEVFLQLQGSGSRGNRIASSDLAAVKRQTVLGEGLPADAVVVAPAHAGERGQE